MGMDPSGYVRVLRVPTAGFPVSLVNWLSFCRS